MRKRVVSMLLFFSTLSLVIIILLAQKTVNIKKVVDISYNGFNGEAEVEVKLVRNSFLNQLKLSRFTEAEVLEIQELYRSLKLEIPLYKNLSNGDVINIQVLHNDEISNKLGIKIINSEFKVKISSLYDTFENTVNGQSTTLTGGNRLRTIVNKDDNEVVLLLSKKMQGQSLLAGTMATGIKTGLNSFIIQSKAQKITSKEGVIYEEGQDLKDIKSLEKMLGSPVTSMLSDLLDKELSILDVVKVPYSDLVGKEIRFKVYLDASNENNPEEYTIKFYGTDLDTFNPKKDYEIINNELVEVRK